jgi:small ligand-binding sensory domain FIST
MYKFQNSVANASTPKELQAKAALVKLQKLVNELSAKETELIAKETMGKLTPQEVTSALAEYGVHRADFLKALK